MSIINDLQNLLYRKEDEFILLTMNRFIEDDLEYLKTLSIDKLNKLRDKIKENCDDIKKIDLNILSNCNKLVIIFKSNIYMGDENNIFKNFLLLNNNLNSYLLMLMNTIPLNDKENIYQIYINKKNEIKKSFGDYDPESQQQQAQPPQQKVRSPLQQQEALKEKPPQQQQEALKEKPKSKSHSFSSKISDSPHSPDIKKDMYETKLDNFSIVAIHIENNYDFFLNAIFDYCLYTNNIQNIYRRLITIETKILKNIDKFKENIIHIHKIIDNYDNEENKDILNIKKIKSIFGNLVFLQNSNNIYYYTTDNEQHKKYQKHFTNFIKYIYVLYTFTYGYNTFKKYIQPYINNSDITLSDYKKKYINNVKDADDYIQKYLLSFLINENIKYYDKEFIDSINKILFTKIKNSDNDYIPRFWLNNIKYSNTILFNLKEYRFYLQKNYKKKKFRENKGIYIYISFVISYIENNIYLIIPKNNLLDENEKILLYNNEKKYSSNEKVYI
jgi:flagellar motor protein MotB